MSGERVARLALFAANACVSALDLACALASGEARDWLAALAWAGSAGFWLWQATREEG